MPEHSEILKSMLQDIINDRHDQAEVSMHEYFVAKTREVAGLNAAPSDIAHDGFDDE